MHTAKREEQVIVLSIKFSQITAMPSMARYLQWCNRGVHILVATSKCLIGLKPQYWKLMVGEVIKPRELAMPLY